MRERFPKQHLQKKTTVKPTEQKTATAMEKNTIVDGVISDGGGGGSTWEEFSALISMKT